MKTATSAVIITYRCAFCRRRQLVSASAGDVYSAHGEIAELVNSGCPECGGKMLYDGSRSVEWPQHLNSNTFK